MINTITIAEYLKGKGENQRQLFHVSDTDFQDPLDDSYSVDPILECVYAIADDNGKLLFFGDIGDEVVFGFPNVDPRGSISFVTLKTQKELYFD